MTGTDTTVQIRFRMGAFCDCGALIAGLNCVDIDGIGPERGRFEI